MTYSSASDVAAYTPNLLEHGGNNFTATTTPTKSSVEAFLTMGYNIINARLSAAGYSTPVDSGTAVYHQVRQLEIYYGAAQAETVRLTARVAATERTRAQYFQSLFDKGIEALLKMDLSAAGAGVSTSRLYAGGISVSDKADVESDSDRVTPRFSRGQFDYQGTERPGGGSDDATTDQ